MTQRSTRPHEREGERTPRSVQATAIGILFLILGVILFINGVFAVFLGSLQNDVVRQTTVQDTGVLLGMIPAVFQIIIGGLLLPENPLPGRKLVFASALGSILAASLMQNYLNLVDPSNAFVTGFLATLTTFAVIMNILVLFLITIDWQVNA